MKHLIILLLAAVSACNAPDDTAGTEVITDTVAAKVDNTRVETETDDTTKIAKPPPVSSNKRFKDVTVEKTGEHKFLIKGKGQIFEASFSWVVEDGHEELKKGFEMTDAGAPEWGNFSFTVDVAKKRSNSTLHLILFETSAKDGSRQYELPIFLY